MSKYRDHLGQRWWMKSNTTFLADGWGFRFCQSSNKQSALSAGISTDHSLTSDCVSVHPSELNPSLVTERSVLPTVLGRTTSTKTPQLEMSCGVREWTGGELNSRHQDFQSCALPTELPVQMAASRRRMTCSQTASDRSKYSSISTTCNGLRQTSL